MADEELQANGAEEQKDLQSATDQTDRTDSAAESEEDTAAEDNYGVDMDQVEAVLNATADKNMMTPQMQRMMARQAESTKRVEESIKGTKSNPRWFVPLFCLLMVIGLIWVVAYYLTGKFPIPAIGVWNLVVGFVTIMIGFLMTMWWR